MPLTTDASPFRGIPGLVWAFRFDADGHGRALDIDAIGIDEVARQPPGWLWLHFNQGDARSAHSIQHLPGLPDAAREALLDHEAHTGIAFEDGIAHGVLIDWEHGGVDNFSRAYVRCEQDTAWMRFMLGDRLLITSRSHALRSLEQVRRHAAAGTRFETPVNLLEAFVEGFAAATAHATLELDNDLDRIEDRVLGEHNGDERRELALLRRQAVHLYRPVSSLRRTLRQFEQRNRAQREHELVQAAQSLMQNFDEIDSEILAVQARARLLHEEVASKLAEQTNRHLHSLSILTAVLMPPTLVVGAFGMNFPLPFENGKHPFFAVTLLCIGSSLFVYWLIRRLGESRD